MSESKVEINQRKIRKGQRKSTEAQQKQVWDKLSAPPVLPPKPLSSPFASSATVKITRSSEKQVWYCPADLEGKTFSDIEIDEWGSN